MELPKELLDRGKKRKTRRGKRSKVLIDRVLDLYEELRLKEELAKPSIGYSALSQYNNKRLGDAIQKKQIIDAFINKTANRHNRRGL